MPHTKLLRELLHDLSNALTGLQGSLENILLSDIEPGQSRECYQEALQCCHKLGDIITRNRDELHNSYQRHYTTYKGEPMLKDKNGSEIHMKDFVEVPDPTTDDLWEHSFVGIVISTTRGDGIITVRDTADDCWDVEASRVEKLK
jgi:hypothetical protein